MKNSVALLLFAAAMQGAAFGIFSFPARAQTNDASSIAVPAPDAGRIIPNEPQAPSQLAPLSSLSNTTSAAPAKETKVRHAYHRKSRHRKKYAGARKPGEHTRVRTAQVILAELGYRPGPSDGVMGAKTKMALKQFQRDHHLRADGVLGPITYDALTREGGSKNPMQNSSAPPEDFYAKHPDYYGYFGPDYANPTSFGSPQTIPSRFGALELAAQQTGQTYRFDVVLNGRSVIHADNQSTPVNVSRTFNLSNADAVVVTAYAPGDSVCPYRHYLLVVRPNTSGLYPIEECTRDYRAYTENGMLYISFPGPHVSGWSSGAMWRYDNGAFEKL